MTEPLPLQPSSALRAPAATRPPAGAHKPSEFGDGALAFKTLLEQLEDRTRALEVESRKDLSQDDLAGAVDNARASLEQMLSLKDQLLEAWRATQLDGSAGAGRG